MLAISSFTFDKAVYTPGDVITLTVAYTSDDLDPGTSVSTAVNVALSDASNTVTQASDGSTAFPLFTVETANGAVMATSVSVTDPRPGTWTLVSNGFDPASTAAPFAGTAVLTSVA